jgi:hypothetical protein
MLTDQEVVMLTRDDAYKSAVKIGLSQIVGDILDSGASDLKPSVSDILKVLSKIWRRHTIRAELKVCTSALLERLLNRELNWPRTADSIKSVCDSHEAGYKWMRYDEPRVSALFRRCQNLMTEAAFRGAVKTHSSLSEEDKNRRLEEIQNEIAILKDRVILSIQTRGLYDGWTRINADLFYRENEDDIQRKFLSGTRSGQLGLPGGNEQQTK